MTGDRFPLPVNTAIGNACPSTRTGHPSTRAVNSGSGNQALLDGQIAREKVEVVARSEKMTSERDRLVKERTSVEKQLRETELKLKEMTDKVLRTAAAADGDYDDRLYRLILEGVIIIIKLTFFEST